MLEYSGETYSLPLEILVEISLERDTIPGILGLKSKLPGGQKQTGESICQLPIHLEVHTTPPDLLQLGPGLVLK